MAALKFNLSHFVACVALVLVGLASPYSLAAEDSNDGSVVNEHRMVIVHCDPESEDCDTGQHDYSFMFHGGRQGGFLGVELTGMTPELRSHFGVDEDRGVMVSRVTDDSPAFRAGIEPGDIITAADGIPMSSKRDLIGAILPRSDGDAVDLEIWRSGASEVVTAILDQRSPALLRHHDFHLGCDDANADCDIRISRAHRADSEQACGDMERCEVEIRCVQSDECTCTVNGDIVDCEQVAGFHNLHD